MSVSLDGPLARSLAAAEPLDEFEAWFAERRAAHAFRVGQAPLEALDDWSFDPVTGNLGHRSGRFFTIEGLRVTAAGRTHEQPVIRQPEVGILGILTRTVDGIPRFLMQAKMEPGNPGLLQLSPTIQATYSNYTGVHGGQPVRFLDHFRRPDRGRVVTDVLQSENGCWFLHKRNRNMIVQVDEEVEPHPDFHWLTLGQLGALLRRDNTVNMDARSVLACLPLAGPAPSSAGRADGTAGDDARYSDTELRSWFTAELARRHTRTQLVPLAELADWRREDGTIRHRTGRYFDIVGITAEAASREVARWSQPLLRPHGQGLAAFLTRRIDGIPHLLARASAEAGLSNGMEIGPTVQHIPGDCGQPDRVPFLDLVRDADPSAIRYDAVHSDEGGRFQHSESRYLVVETDDDQVPLDPPPGYLWLTPGQLNSLVQHQSYVNVQARTLLACLGLGAVTRP
ncbi:NDP-hexose 2,3-dehydratase family protein [Streptomyces sp. NRRL S-350]|uniref:NDP-hexose 2,3-dehydratase family protein n=1 Tax=Streptomyces sp. NRRL S-350 TaxID=1463902 RepID=UPI001F2F073F|nr:NDP-hexose 2,3-dehydratase family protein [Streptomyces sp. NRRL S-350]